MKKQHRAETTHKIFLALSSFFFIFCLKSNLKVCSFFFFFTINKAEQEKQGKKQATGREAIENGKPKWVAPTSYFIFHAMLLFLEYMLTCLQQLKCTHEHTRLHLFLFSHTVNSDSIQTKHACTNIHSYTLTHNNSNPKAP